MSTFSSHRPSLLFLSGMGLVFLLAVLARIQQVSFFFLSDDFTLIDAVVQGGPFGIWSSQGSPFFRPLVSLSFFLNYRLGGVNPAGYYLLNLLLHAANACLVTWIAWLLFGDHYRQPLPSRVDVAAVVAGACFAVAPTLGESVVWIAGRTDLIASFFGLLAFALFISWRRKGYVVLIAAGTVCFVLGLLSKEAVVTLPFALLGYEVFRQWSSGTWNIRFLVGWSVAAVMLVVAYIVVRMLVIGTLVGGYGAAMHLNIRSIPIVLAQAFGHMFVMAPLRQGFAATALIVTVCLVGVAVQWRRDVAPHPGIYILPFAIAMLALIAFLPAATYPIGPFVPSGFGFRTLYLPAAFGFIALAALVQLAVQHAGVLALIGVLATGANTWTLTRTYAYWAEASQISEAVVDELRQLPATQGPETVLILNVPERTRVGGVHIFRNGLESAGHIFADPGGQRTFVRVSRQEIANISDATRVEYADTTYTLRFASGNSRLLTRFDPFAPTPADTPWYTLPLMTEDSLVMHLKPSARSSPVRVLSLSAGRLHEIPVEADR